MSTPSLRMPTVVERLESLRRPEKWYLSSGDGFIWAPAFPAWLHTPGFWDEAHIYYGPFAPLFTVALIDAHGVEIPLIQSSRLWQPGRLVSRYSARHLSLIETKTLAPNGRFRSVWSIENSGGFESFEGCHLVAFTAQPGPDVRDAAKAGPGRIRWERTLIDRREVPMHVLATLSARAVQSDESDEVRDFPVSAVRSEGSAVQPHWRFTPFEERWNLRSPDSARGEVPPALSIGLREEVRLEGINTNGLMYAAVGVPLGRVGSRAVVFELRVELKDAEHRIRSRVPEAEAERVDFDPWPSFMASFPAFVCDDAYLTRYYDYRTYGLHLCRLEAGAGNVHHPCVAEGIAYFHVPITYSGQCHMFEMRWQKEPAVARGTLLNFLDTQHPDGSFNGRIYTNHLKGTDFYHANWGDAILGVDAVHPEPKYLSECYDRLGRYAEWLSTQRDPDRSGMCIVINHFETGQEYMSRYQAVNPRADEDGWKDTTRLQAIDATVYVYLLHQAMERLATRLGHADQAKDWASRAAFVGKAIQERMWDEAGGMYSDVDPATGKRTGVKAAVCFYPLMTDMVSEAQVGAMLKHLTEPHEFATRWPLPSSSADDVHFNPEADWKGRRHVCPWNGRVWPMTNSHVIDGLIRQWHRRSTSDGSAPVSPRARAGVQAGHLLDRFVKLMFHNGELARPNCFEHYNPFTGRACEYRGIDDYQHSWVNDLIIRGLCGLEPVAHDGWSAGMCVASPKAGVLVDPLPMAVERFEIRDVPVRGRLISVRRDGSRFAVTLDGAPTGESVIGRGVFVPLA